MMRTRYSATCCAHVGAKQMPIGSTVMTIGVSPMKKPKKRCSDV